MEGQKEMTYPEFSWSLSDKGKKMLIALEGYTETMYNDIGGKLTFGIGHLVTTGEKKEGYIDVVGKDHKLYRVSLNNSSNESIMMVFEHDLRMYEIAVMAVLKKFDFSDFAKRWSASAESDDYTILTCKFDALTMLAFNIGLSAFSLSTLSRTLKMADVLYNDELDNAVIKQMRRWNRVNGKVSKGLVNRRKAEVALYKDYIYQI